MDSKIAGGRKWKPDGGGDIIRAIWQNTNAKPYEADPRADVLIDLALLLGGTPYRAFESAGIELAHAVTPEVSVYVVVAAGEVVFESVYLPNTSGVTYGIFAEGEWRDTLAHLAEEQRGGRV